MEGEPHDWELLHGSGSAAEDNNFKSFEEIEDATQGMIRSDYFSLDNNDMCRADLVDDVSEDGSNGSGNPSWIEPGSDAPCGKKHSSEFWSDSGSDRSEDRKLVDLDVTSELGLEYSGKNDVAVCEHAKRQIDLREYSDSRVQDKHMKKYWSDSSGDKLNSGIIPEESEGLYGDIVAKEDESTLSGELICGNDPVEHLKGGEEKSCGREPLAIDPSEKSGVGREKKGIVWWKIPLELLKYCVFKVNPVWSFSMAAAVMGFVILGRRLYKMKKKSRSLQLKVTVDDKKASQLMNHTTRLSEAASMVKRVPIIRPALPATAMNQWTMVSLR